MIRKFYENNILVFFIITNCFTFDVDEMLEKEKERDMIILRALFDQPDYKKKVIEEGIIQYVEGKVYGFAINSKESQLRIAGKTFDLPIHGIKEMIDVIKSQILLPKNLANYFMEKASNVETRIRFANYFREIWVEFGRIKDRRNRAELVFGKKGGEFFMFFINRIKEYQIKQ